MPTIREIQDKLREKIWTTPAETNEAVRGFDEAGKVGKALAVMYDWVDAHMWFAHENDPALAPIIELLEGVDVDRRSFSVLVGYLTITIPVKHRIAVRSVLFQKVRARLDRELPDRSIEILRGLE